MGCRNQITDLTGRPMKRTELIISKDKRLIKTLSKERETRRRMKRKPDVIMIQSLTDIHEGIDMRSIMIITGLENTVDIASIKMEINETTEIKNIIEVMNLTTNSILVSLSLILQKKTGEVIKKDTIKTLECLMVDQDLTITHSVKLK